MSCEQVTRWSWNRVGCYELWTGNKMVLKKGELLLDITGKVQSPGIGWVIISSEMLLVKKLALKSNGTYET